MTPSLAPPSLPTVPLPKRGVGVGRVVRFIALSTLGGKRGASL